MKGCLSDPLKSLTCAICQQEDFHSAIALKKHSAETHERYIYVCDICDNVYENYNTWNSHKSAHKKTKPKNLTFKCPHCEKVFDRKSRMNYHILNVHGDESITHYKCSHCDYKCKMACQLKEHVNATHTKEILYQCQYCDFSSYRKKNLQGHVTVVHEKRKPNKCEFCSAAFYYSRDLKNHMTRHHPSA